VNIWARHPRSRGHGRSSRRASSPAAAASRPRLGAPRERRPTAETLSPAKALATRSIYRTFLLKGLAPDEAANLTAFVCGIPVQDLHWSLRQVNQLLFLREMAHTGRFGGDDGRPDRPP
jgi:hypothetical protein